MWGGTDPQIDYLRLELPRQKRRASSNVNGYREGLKTKQAIRKRCSNGLLAFAGFRTVRSREGDNIMPSKIVSCAVAHGAPDGHVVNERTSGKRKICRAAPNPSEAALLCPGWTLDPSSRFICKACYDMLNKNRCGLPPRDSNRVYM